jgi:hypothetical protein
MGLGLGCASASKPRFSNNSFVISVGGRWYCCEVQYGREECFGDNLSTTSFGEYFVAVIVDNSLDSGTKSDTGEEEFETPSPASRRRYEISNRSGFRFRLCLRLLTVMPR